MMSNIGSNLEKPKLFMKRMERSETTQLGEVLLMEGQYEKKMKKCEEEEKMNKKRILCEREREMAERSKCEESGAPSPSMCGGMGGHRGFRDFYVSGLPQPIVSLGLSTSNNFLSTPGIISPNSKTLTFKIPLGYSHFQCLMLTQRDAVLRSYNYSVRRTSTKNIRHWGIKDSGNGGGLTMSREIYKANKGEKVKIGRESVWAAVGLWNLVGFAKIKGAIL
jgi:hypothetical protein